MVKNQDPHVIVQLGPTQVHYDIRLRTPVTIVNSTTWRSYIRKEQKKGRQHADYTEFQDLTRIKNVRNPNLS